MCIYTCVHICVYMCMHMCEIWNMDLVFWSLESGLATYSVEYSAKQKYRAPYSESRKRNAAKGTKVYIFFIFSMVLSLSLIWYLLFVT